MNLHMNILMATLHFFPSWSCLTENGLKPLLYKLGGKCFKSTEHKIKELEVLQIPVNWRKRRQLKCVILEENCFCNWEATYQPILAIYIYIHTYIQLHSLTLTCRINGDGRLISHSPGAIISVGGSFSNVMLNSIDPRMDLLQKTIDIDIQESLQEGSYYYL